MHKSLYSLMLLDELVERVDRLAAEQGTNRSNLVNQILAEYLSVTTPEMRIGSVFRQIESLMNEEMGGIVPFVNPHQLTMSMKSSLAYKYRPTIKYELEMFRTPHDAAGRLSVVFRSQSEALVAAMNDFFRLWIGLEEKYLGSAYERGLLERPEYELYEGRFTRTFAPPRDRDHDERSLGRALNDYISMFDRLLKEYLARHTERDAAQQIELKYRDYLNRGVGLL